MEWLSLTFLAGFANIGYDFLTRHSLKGKANPLEYTWSFGVIRTIIFGLWTVFSFKILITPSNLYLLLLIGLLNVLNISLLMKMHSLNELSISATIMTLRIIWVPAFAFLVLGEILTTTQYIGIFILFIGVSLVASLKKLFKDKAKRTALMFSITTAFTTVLIKSVVGNNSVPVIALFMSFPIVIVVPFFIKDKLRFVKKLTNDLPQKFGIAVFSVITLSTLTTALSFGEVGRVNSIFQSMAILSVILGIVFLKERQRISYKMLGILLAILGSFLVI